MLNRRLLALAVPLLTLALIGGDCGCDSSTEPPQEEPLCVEPVYDPGMRSVNALIDAPFSLDIHPTFPAQDHHPVYDLSMLSGLLPPGVQVDVSQLDQGIAFVEGTPTELGSWTSIWEATVSCDESEPTASLELTIEVVENCPAIDAPISVLIEAEPGEGIDLALGVTGGIGMLSYALYGDLPAGLEFDGETALDAFVGFVGAATEEGSFSATITVTDECSPPQSVEIPVTIVIGCPIFYGQPDIVIGAEVGASFSEELDLVGGVEPFGFQLTGDLPPGVSFDGEIETDPFTGFEGAGTTSGSWELTLTVSDACSTPQSVDIPVTITITEAGGEIPPGTYGCSLRGLEMLVTGRYIDYDTVEAPYLVGAGSNGWAQLSLSSPYFATLGSNAISAYWHAIPMAGGWDGSDYATKGMFASGETGALFTAYDGGWGWSQGWSFNAVSDACGLDVAAGPEGRGELTWCEAGAARVMHIRYDADSGGFATYGAPIYSSTFGSAVPRSTCPVESGSGGAFILCDANGGEDGKLWYGDFDSPFDPCVEIADIGPQPVCVRKEGDIWAATDFTANTLTCGLVNSGPDAAATFTANTDSGPFRIAMLALGRGDTAVACVNFGDDTVSLFVVDELGQQVSSATLSLPAECSAPGGLAFLPDGSRNLVVGCNATDNLAVLETGLE